MPLSQTNSVDGVYTVKVWNPVGTNQAGAWTVRVVSLPKAGSTVAWGKNNAGQINYPVDLTNTLSIAAGDFHSVAVREDGGVVQWGHAWASVPANLTNAIAVAAGSQHTVALRSNGTVVCWGTNTLGQTNVPVGLTNVIAVAAGGNQSLALRQDGSVTNWGQTFATKPASVTNIIAIASGTNFHLALRSNSTVVAWGLNNFGQTNVPAGLSNVVAIAAGGYHALAVKTDGTVVAWRLNANGQTNVPVGLSNVMAVAAGWKHSAALKNDGTVVCWGDNSNSQTNVPGSLNTVKLIAAGGDHTLAAIFSSLVQYPVDVTKDLLLIYNSTSTNSIWVKDYYLAHRPKVSGANVLGIGCATNEIIGSVNFTNQVLTNYLNWLNANPTKRPQYLIWFYDLPGRVEDGQTAFWSPSFFLHTNTPGIKPFVTCINMRTPNDCKAYIDKLEFFGSNSPNKLFISASQGEYGNTNYVIDSIKNGFGHLDDYTGAATVSVATNGLLNAGVASASILFADGEETITNGVFHNLPHIMAATNVAGYVCWGAHSSLGDKYATNGVVHWSGDSKWWIIETIESYNGQRDNPNTGQSSVLHWYSNQAFGGTNYSNTPVGAVSHVEEPGLGRVNKTDIYFGRWAAGKCFGDAAWNSRITPYFQAVGDPFTKK